MINDIFYFNGIGINIIVQILIYRLIIIKLILNNDSQNFNQHYLFWFPFLIIISCIVYAIFYNLEIIQL